MKTGASVQVGVQRLFHSIQESAKNKAPVLPDALEFVSKGRSLLLFLAEELLAAVYHNDDGECEQKHCKDDLEALTHD